MTDTRPITLGTRTFDVPALPLRVCRVVYPLIRKLNNDGLIDRILAANGSLDCTQEEFDDLVEIAFLMANAAEPVSNAEFDEMPITPPQLVDTLFAARYQSGGWVQIQAGDEDSGEAQGAAQPPQSTSGE